MHSKSPEKVVENKPNQKNYGCLAQALIALWNWIKRKDLEDLNRQLDKAEKQKKEPFRKSW